MPVKHRIRLGAEERQRLERLVRTGRAHARSIRHAHILLLSDEGEHGPAWTDEKVTDALGCGLATVARLRRRFVGEGLEACLRVIKDRPGRPPKIDGVAEAHLVALACSEPPEGRARWTVRLLADEFVELGLEKGFLRGPLSHETVRQVLKKTRCGLTARSSG